MDQFLFSKHERALLRVLSVDGKRPRDLMRTTRIPHASLYLAFQKLRTRGLAKRAIREGKIYWLKVDVEEGVLVDINDNRIVFHSTPESVRRCVNQVLSLSDGSRITIVEGTQKESGWFNLFSKKDTMKLNLALSGKRIICESIIPESYFEDAIPYLGEDWALSYKTRPIITYVVKHGLISSSAMLIILPSKIILLYAREVLAIEIKNKEMVALIKGMTEIIKENARKVEIAENFTFHDL